MFSLIFTFRGRLTILISVLLISLLALVSCGRAEETPKLEETISLAGSTSVEPLAKRLALAYMENNPQITINISGGDSTVGVKSVWEETVDIGMASRELELGEPELMTFVIARDGVVVIVHSVNKVEGLSREEVYKIFSGEITNWKNVGGEDDTITIVSLEEGSETRATFEKWVMEDKPITAGAFFLSSNSLVRANVAKGLDAISYYPLSRLDSTVKALAIDGVEATIENIKAGIYPVPRLFYFLTKETPRGEVKKFIDFCLGPEGQQIVVDMGYVPAE
ncbi:Phosphate-binding protein PstS 1 [subsurface metagenome]